MIKKHRGRRKKEQSINPASNLLEALNFIKPVIGKTKAELWEKCCYLNNNWLIASNSDNITITTPIEDNLSAFPQYIEFVEALKKVNDELSITNMGDSISVVSGDFKAVITQGKEPAYDNPDENIAVINNDFKKALNAVLPFAKGNSKRQEFKAVFVNANFCAAVLDGYSAAEYWHNINLPSFILPVKTAEIISKIDKDLTGFGYSGKTATFWFSDNSFIVTELLIGETPSYQNFFKNCDYFNIPDKFFEYVKTIHKLSENDNVYLRNNRLQSSSNDNEASYVQLSLLPNDMILNAKTLLLFKDFDKISFDEENNVVYFVNNFARGFLAGIDKGDEID